MGRAQCNQLLVMFVAAVQAHFEGTFLGISPKCLLLVLCVDYTPLGFELWFAWVKGNYVYISFLCLVLKCFTCQP